MYVHIGNEEMLKCKDIVAILDVETLKQSRNNLRILNMLKNQSNNIKSVILTYKDGEAREVFSIISASTIKNRISHVYNLWIGKQKF